MNTDSFKLHEDWKVPWDAAVHIAKLALLTSTTVTQTVAIVAEKPASFYLYLSGQLILSHIYDKICQIYNQFG